MYQPALNKKIIGRINVHEQINVATQENRSLVDIDNRKILIIHTGGTIGMFKDQNGKFKPEKHQFQRFLKEYPYFCDDDETYFNSYDDFMITPVSIFGKKIWYKFFQFETLIDSTNMSIERINIICSYIEKQYENYDAFIVLHGTDTLSYTSSALSFLIENLKKTVIITGSQIPIGQTRNDAVNNLLCALTIAGHYIIPQVLVIFDNFVLRGNRTTKASASNFNAFKSPNYTNIGHLGIKIVINWELILPSRMDQPTKFHKMEVPVSVMKLTPFGYNSVPKNKYIVIESYGVGNIPTQGAFYDWVKQNATKPQEEKCVIVNISQVYQSVILNLYATGNQAVKLGLIPGSDMTCEAAVAKLSFLATQKLSIQELVQKMSKNLRGQLTEQQDRLAFQKDNYSIACMTILQKNFLKHSQFHKQILKNIVYPHLIVEKTSKHGIQRMISFGTNFNAIQPDGGNLLHQYCKDSILHDHHETYVKYLLDKKVDINLVDKEGNSAMFYALQKGKYRDAELIQKAGGLLQTTYKRIFSAIRNQQISLLHALIKFGDEFTYQNQQKRNCLVQSIITNKKKIFNFFCDFTNLHQNLDQQDIYGKSVSYYMKQFGFEIGIDRQQSQIDEQIDLTSTQID